MIYPLVTEAGKKLEAERMCRYFDFQSLSKAAGRVVQKSRYSWRKLSIRSRLLAIRVGSSTFTAYEKLLAP
jgi:hypothetical protein